MGPKIPLRHQESPSLFKPQGHPGRLKTGEVQKVQNTLIPGGSWKKRSSPQTAFEEGIPIPRCEGVIGDFVQEEIQDENKVNL
jgi:hypothetical protein